MQNLITAQEINLPEYKGFLQDDPTPPNETDHNNHQNPTSPNTKY